MSIFDSYKYKTVFRDFDFLKGCFGNTRIMPTDIDGLVERNGKFLLLEFKPEGKTVSTGQRITLSKLAKLDMFTVVIVWHVPCAMHEPKIPSTMWILPDKKIIDTDVDGVRAVVKEWWNMANGG